MRKFHVYIMTNFNRTVVYTGVTSNLPRRVSQHKAMQQPSFTKRYKAIILVYVETYNRALEAIAREKQIKGLVRAKKDALITAQNPTWRDLADDF
jgi:putative endonuclease